MFRLVKDGEFESPQEAAWLFCAGELPVERARELANHWLITVEATDALIGFEVECLSATKPLAWWWLKPLFEQALESLCAEILEEGVALSRVAAQQTERFVTGRMPREEFVYFLDRLWQDRDFDFPESFEKFAKATKFCELWHIATDYDMYPPSQYPSGFKDNIDASLDDAARRAHEKIKASGFTS